MRTLISIGVCLIASSAALRVLAADHEAKSPAKTPIAMAPKVGIKTPGIQIPFADVKVDLEIPVPTPGYMTIGESVFVPSASKDEVVRIPTKSGDAKAADGAKGSGPAKPLEPIAGVSKPCSGTIVAFGTLWVPNCGPRTVTRHDTKTNKVIATLPIGSADVTIGLAATADSVWMFTDNKSTLSRIDPIENKVVGELRLPASCNSVAFGETALWVSCPAESKVLRIDPSTNLVVNRIEVAAGARSVAFGAGSVWVLCDKEGIIQRIDPKTNKVIKSVELLVPNAGGGIAYGEGFLWATQSGFPLTRIDTTSEKERVAQQFWGKGGGLIAVSSGAIWLADPINGTVQKLDPKRVIATLAD
jgi:virginiamycin B lyase